MKIFKYTALALLQLLLINISKAQTTKADDDRGYIVKVGDQAPDDFQLVLTNGTTTSLKKLRGKIVILQFTASWCSVCREEMPHLESDVWKAYKNRGLVLIGVDRDEPMPTVKKFHHDMKLSYPLALDPKADIFGRFANKKSGVTRNVVIDPTGKIVYLTRLYDKEEFNGMLAAIKNLVDKPTASLR
ncbi:TlpA family protein disulfide reductase [Mucilaginibacter sp. BJC16-A38]|uniref:peroxiredoxin family protein n=1 Tax=Mucilaginibacter phenanthrenivorans TaxID=1234842 RepID=UPI002157B7AF|nr:TlpA disulfide reductase family protein [Mucilaginibacter phenanthrenivorans]MCR8557259.1 TlpA family protein disulfide reductase [Mucilaginibacter phenanthrenivorans]